MSSIPSGNQPIDYSAFDPTKCYLEKTSEGYTLKLGSVSKARRRWNALTSKQSGPRPAYIYEEKALPSIIESVKLWNKKKEDKITRDNFVEKLSTVIGVKIDPKASEADQKKFEQIINTVAHTIFDKPKKEKLESSSFDSLIDDDTMT